MRSVVHIANCRINYYLTSQTQKTTQSMSPRWPGPALPCWQPNGTGTTLLPRCPNVVQDPPDGSIGHTMSPPEQKQGRATQTKTSRRPTIGVKRRQSRIVLSSVGFQAYPSGLESLYPPPFLHALHRPARDCGYLLQRPTEPTQPATGCLCIGSGVVANSWLTWLLMAANHDTPEADENSIAAKRSARNAPRSARSASGSTYQQANKQESPTSGCSYDSAGRTYGLHACLAIE